MSECCKILSGVIGACSTGAGSKGGVQVESVIFADALPPPLPLTEVISTISSYCGRVVNFNNPVIEIKRNINM